MQCFMEWIQRTLGQFLRKAATYRAAASWTAPVLWRFSMGNNPSYRQTPRCLNGHHDSKAPEDWRRPKPRGARQAPRNLTPSVVSSISTVVRILFEFAGFLHRHRHSVFWRRLQSVEIRQNVR